MHATSVQACSAPRGQPVKKVFLPQEGELVEGEFEMEDELEDMEDLAEAADGADTASDDEDVDDDEEAAVPAGSSRPRRQRPEPKQGALLHMSCTCGFSG